MLAYAAIFLASVAGYAQFSALVVPVGAVILATISYIENVRLYRRAAALGLQAQIDSTLMSSIVNALGATTLAYAGGLILKLLSA